MDSYTLSIIYTQREEPSAMAVPFFGAKKYNLVYVVLAMIFVIDSHSFRD